MQLPIRALLAVFSAACLVTQAQPPESTASAPAAPAILPGKGLAQHDFFYAGEQKQRNMYIVKGGQVVWSYLEPNGKGEISDAVLMSNGNVLFAHQFGVTMINPAKEVVWNSDAPTGTEIHTAQPIGTNHVLFIQNGNPAILRVVNIVTGATEKEFTLETGNPASVHGQFRRARLTGAGTILVAHMDMKKVSEYDSAGKEVWSVAIETPWSALRLKNGNTLIATNKNLVREVDPKGQTVWEFKPEDIPAYRLSGFQTANRLPNGNTLVNNWVNMWSTTIDRSNAEVQALEITPDKRVVWALREWNNPDLGPATTIQLLNGNVPENVHFGEIH
jgi:hypothetical protein